MLHKPNLLHLLVVPVIVLLISNDFTAAWMWKFSRTQLELWQSLFWVTMLLYSLYLYGLRRSGPISLGPLGLLAGAGLALLSFEWPSLIWWTAALLIFAGTRQVILQENRSFPLNCLAVFAGLAAALFLAPASPAAAAGAFLFIQLSYEMSDWGLKKGVVRQADRFRESLRTAERVLAEL